MALLLSPQLDNLCVPGYQHCTQQSYICAIVFHGLNWLYLYYTYAPFTRSMATCVGAYPCDLMLGQYLFFVLLPRHPILPSFSSSLLQGHQHNILLVFWAFHDLFLSSHLLNCFLDAVQQVYIYELSTSTSSTGFSAPAPDNSIQP